MTGSTKRDYYTIPEAARILSVSSSTVWRWIKSGRLSAYRVGERSIRIKSVDLESVVSPVNPSKVEPSDLFADYDPEAVRAALAETVGGWSDLDADELISELYAARQQGSRPDSRP